MSVIPTKACHGCGIGMIENWILQALEDLDLTQEDVIFGTGIGCVGRQTYATWGGDNFGATHGRVLSVATGLKLAQHYPGFSVLNYAPRIAPDAVQDRYRKRLYGAKGGSPWAA